MQLTRTETVDVSLSNNTQQTQATLQLSSAAERRDIWGLLVCMAGSAHPVTLRGPSITCGRLHSNTVIIDDERVSSVQFEIVVDEQRATYTLLDKSRNGTFVNHKRIGCGRKCRIASGDEIEVVFLPSPRVRRDDDATEDKPIKKYVRTYMFSGYCHIKREKNPSPSESILWAETASVAGDDPVPSNAEDGDDDPLFATAASPKLSWQWGSIIGRGAFSEVYVGIDTNTGMMIAIKVLSNPNSNNNNASSTVGRLGENGDSLVISPGGTLMDSNTIAGGNELNGNAGTLRRRESTTSEYSGISGENRAEMKLLRSLHHRRIVRYLGFTREEDTLCILLEYVAGGSLHSLITNFGGFLEPVVRIYSLQILQGLEYLHLNHVVHGDIKPMNILVSDAGQVKLSDFGTSRFTSAAGGPQSQDPSLTMFPTAGTLTGTPAYMSPELIQTTRSTFASDIWAFGCVVFEMVTGEPPWSELETKEIAPIIYAIGNSTTGPSLEKLNQLDISENLKDFIQCCFTLPADARPSASDLLMHRFVCNDGFSTSPLAPASLIASVNAPAVSSTTASAHSPPVLSQHLDYLHNRALSDITPKSQPPVITNIVHRNQSAPTSFPSCPVSLEASSLAGCGGESSGLTSKFRILEAS